jgi:predicted nucleic acid-binding Zn ribbon protein
VSATSPSLPQPVQHAYAPRRPKQQPTALSAPTPSPTERARHDRSPARGLCPSCGMVALQGQQTVCSNKCRAKRTWERQAKRDSEVRELLERALKRMK